MRTSHFYLLGLVIDFRLAESGYFFIINEKFQLIKTKKVEKTLIPDP